MQSEYWDVAIIGAGIIGISTAYYLKRQAPSMTVVLIDKHQPMTFTSAQSGENYRDWWAHPTMKSLADRSIDLMDDIARTTGNRIDMTRRGYVLATRSPTPEKLLGELDSIYRGDDEQIRLHENQLAEDYVNAVGNNWQSAPSGVDVLLGKNAVREAFPWFDPQVSAIVHIRRAGSISSQQMGQLMLERFREAGGRCLEAEVVGIENSGGFTLRLAATEEPIYASRIVNAAGPFVAQVAGWLEVGLPVRNVLKQKISFEDTERAIPRQMPFSIDIDPQTLDWTDEERDLLASDPITAWLTERMPGGIHCRPEGGDGGRWIKLGWAYNDTPSNPTYEPALDEHFPEIVLHGAARLNPSLKAYYGHLPANRTLYGGYYTMTNENWPIVGPMGVDRAYVVGAMSGFGTMAACASGELCACWILEDDLPEYSHALSLNRYEDRRLMEPLQSQANLGIL